MRKIFLFTFFTIGLNCFSQTDEATIKSFVHTEHSYLDESGKGIIIQNSYPKGGGVVNGEKGYTAPNGIRFSNGNFWTRIINKSDSPVEIDLNFTGESFIYNQVPDTYFKLLVWDTSVTPEQLPLYNYGLDTFNLAYFLDSNFNKTTNLKRTIQPNEELLFFVIQIAHLSHNGPIRAGLYAEGNSLIYKVNVDPFGEIEFEAGSYLMTK